MKRVHAAAIGWLLLAILTGLSTFFLAGVGVLKRG